MSRPARTIVLFCAGMLCACSRESADELALKRITLPGFSIDVPEGEVISTSAAPAEGKHVIKLPEPTFVEKAFDKAHDAGTISIEWSSQPLSRDDWKATMLPTLLEAFETDVARGSGLLKEAAAGKDRWVYVMGTPRAPIGVGVITCDTAFSVIVAFARYRDVERQFAGLSRIVKSVQCAVTDANRARPIAATRLPDKFGRTLDRDVQIFQALDGEQVLINFTQSDVQRNHGLYRKLLRSLLANSMGLEIPDSQLEILPAGPPRPAGKSSLMRANFPETQESLYIGTQYCPDINLSLIVLWIAPHATDQLARERQSQIGCPGEQSSTPLPFSSIADTACAAGASEFCGLEELAL